MTTMRNQTDLEALIDKHIGLGFKNPHEFYDLLERELGEELFEVARPYLADFVADMARKRLNDERRRAIARITPRSVADPELKLRALWVPDADGSGISYRRIADMTPEDFEARAAYLERMVIGISRHAAWCQSVADEIRSAGVATAGGLERLPELPSGEDLRELPART